MLQSVECNEVSTFKPGSRGIYGVQALVSQKLTLIGSTESSATTDISSFESKEIAFEYHSSKNLNIETNDFNPSQFMSDICENTLEYGLSNDHSKKFKDLVLTMKSWSADQMVHFYAESQAKCQLAR